MADDSFDWSSFNWKPPRLNRPRLEAVAKLLYLKDGGQIEEASRFDVLPDTGDENGSADSRTSLDPLTTTPPGNDYYEKLLIAFLDRLAEIIANVKGGRDISSSLAIAWPDRIDVLVAKTNGFTPGDQTTVMLENLEEGIREISALGLYGTSCPVPCALR